MPLPHGKPEVGRVLTFGKVTSGYNKCTDNYNGQFETKRLIFLSPLFPNSM